MAKKRIFQSLLVMLAMLNVLNLASCKSNSADVSSVVSKSSESNLESDSEEETKEQSSSTASTNNLSVTASQNTRSKRTSKTTSTKSRKKGELVVDGQGKDPFVNYQVKGDVTVAIDTARPTDYEALFDVFSKYYPNVNITYDYFMHTGDNDNASEYLTARASAGKMPDIVYDEAGSLPLYISQGWIKPLDSFVKNDPDYKNVPQAIKDSYTFKGKLFALPHQAQFEVMVLNLDAMDELNIKVPALDWTLEDFEALLKAGTNNKYSGIDEMFGIPDRVSGLYAKDAAYYGYNVKTRKYSMLNTLGEALKFQRKLRDYPGLEGWWMRQGATNIVDSDYAKKFGTSNLDDNRMAFKLGKTITQYYGTWQAPALKNTLKFNFVLWPFPQHKDFKGRMPVHIDHCFMTSSAKNTDAAFALLRYVTYSTEGNIARLSMYDKVNKGKYALNNSLYYPVVTSSKVIEKFESLPGVTEVDKYLLKNIGNSYRADCFKFVPDFRKIHTQIISPAMDQVSDGIKIPEEVLPEAERKANEAIQKAWQTLESKIK